MVRIIKSIGNGSVHAEDWNVNPLELSRYMDPTWYTGDRDRTQDALDWAISSGDVFAPAVYAQFQTQLNASGKKIIVGDINSWLAEQAKGKEPAPAPYVPPVQPPAAACPEGTFRQVKCPKNNKIITQKCVNGIWVTQDTKGCMTDEEISFGLLLAAIILIAVFLFLVRK